MAVYQPTGTVYIIGGVAVDNTYRHTVRFASESERNNYYISKALHTEENCTFIRKDSAIRVGINLENLWDSNYIMYRNASGKYVFCFITAKRYVGEKCTELTIETDVLTTYQFDYTFHDCFVEREHIANDIIGANLVPESLELGDYIFADVDYYSALNALSIVITSTYIDDMDAGTHLFTGVYSPCIMRAFSDHASFKTYLDGLTTANKIDSITAVFMMPTALLPASSGLIQDASTRTYSYNYAKSVSTVDGYTPKNKKLLTYPYNFLTVSTGSGKPAEYHWEYFSDPSNATFDISGNVAANPTAFLIPTAYKGLPANYVESLRLSGYPLCNWSFDAYSAWLAQNMVGSAVQLITGGASLAAGIATANPIAEVSGLAAIAGVLNERYVHSTEPPHSRGTQTDGADISQGIHTFAFMPTSIRAEFAQNIDKYFTAYGYQTNRLKVPSLHTRSRFNYLKTIGCNISGSIDNADLARIKAAYDNGVTMWHYYSGFAPLDYSATNSEV